MKVEPVAFNAYHDESGTYKKDRWFIVGFLFVPEYIEGQVIQALQQERKGYDGEIHFSAIPRDWDKPWSNKALVARRWLRLFVNSVSKSCYLTCLAIDTHSRAFEHKRFGKRFHAYNRFTAIALLSGIAWHFNKYDRVTLMIYSDEKSRRPGLLSLLQEAQENIDNFEDYVPNRVIDEIDQRREQQPQKYPALEILAPIITIPSNVADVEPNLGEKGELIQLTDVILGSIAEAIIAGSTYPTKLELASIVSEPILDTRKKPWEQKYKLHRRFSLSYFPSSEGLIYTNGELAITAALHVDRLI